jgi:cold shock CspA family protein
MNQTKNCMGRSQETFNKKEVRKKKEKKRQEKEKKRLAKKENEKKSSLDDMIAYVDEMGNITSTPPDPDTIESPRLEDIEVSVPKHSSNKPDPIRNGKVTFFNNSKGFGFIEDSETRERIFVHVNNTEDEISEGDLVSFEVESGQKGPSAFNVKLTE